MQKLIFLLLAISGVVISGSVDAFGQDRETVRSELIAAMNRSFELTRDTPFRTRTTVEMRDTSTTLAWRPYSSWLIETVLPDRSYFTYTSRGKGEFIRIGKASYRKDEKGGWVRDEGKLDWSISNPAAPKGLHGPSFEFYNDDLANTANATGYRVVKTPAPGIEDIEKRIVTWTYWFDKTGVLVRHDSVGYNGQNWVRTTEVYEYDRRIRIETPISN